MATAEPRAWGYIQDNGSHPCVNKPTSLSQLEQRADTEAQLNITPASITPNRVSHDVRLPEVEDVTKVTDAVGLQCMRNMGST